MLGYDRGVAGGPSCHTRGRARPPPRKTNAKAHSAQPRPQSNLWPVILVYIFTSTYIYILDHITQCSDMIRGLRAARRVTHVVRRGPPKKNECLGAPAQASPEYIYCYIYYIPHTRYIYMAVSRLLCCPLPPRQIKHTTFPSVDWWGDWSVGGSFGRLVGRPIGRPAAGRPAAGRPTWWWWWWTDRLAATTPWGKNIYIYIYIGIENRAIKFFLFGVSDIFSHSPS